MIDEALIFLKDHVNEHLRGSEGESSEDRVVFVDGEKLDPITFRLNSVTLMLVGTEQERTLKSPQPYVRLGPDGTPRRVEPDIRMMLYVLFVARFKSYEQALKNLSRVIQHFQAFPVFDAHNAPSLSPRVGRLVMEMVSLSFSELDQVWNALRTTYHPSVVYKVSMLVFRDESVRPVTEITESDFDLQHRKDRG